MAPAVGERQGSCFIDVAGRTRGVWRGWVMDEAVAEAGVCWLEDGVRAGEEGRGECPVEEEAVVVVVEVAVVVAAAGFSATSDDPEKEK